MTNCVHAILEHVLTTIQNQVTAMMSRQASAGVNESGRPRVSCRRAREGVRRVLVLAIAVVIGSILSPGTRAAQLWAGVARADITSTQAGPVNDRLYVKALVLKQDATTAAIITVDAVAIGQIGPIGNDYLTRVRSRMQKELGIVPANVLINASHCHGATCADVDERTCRAVKFAAQSMVPVLVAAGTGRESRIMENRRLRLKNGSEADVRHAYSLPPDEEVAGVGPVDPEIGLLRLDRKDGRTLAVVYNFACHPILGVPGGGNTADISGFASRVIEDNLSEGSVALFLQGCGGDINPVFYKDVDHPRNAETLGNMLGLSALQGLRKVRSRDDGRLKVINEVIKLPRADSARRIASMEAEQAKLVRSLKGTSLNLKTFLPLAVKYGFSPGYPSYYSHGYLHEKAMGRDDLSKLDAENIRNMKEYIENIHVMEELTRVQTNLELLRKHQADNVAAREKTIGVELVALRVGGFVLVTFPGELTVRTGLDIKKASPHERTFVAGCTNGYIYYAPTAEQLRNSGVAQEDCDCLLAPEWQELYEKKVAEMLRKL